MKKLLLVLATSLALMGCSTSSNSGYSSQDIMFAEMMIPHHQQAIEMSDLALQNSKDSEVLKLAQQIKDTQAPEIEEMKSWGASSDAHMGHMMDGMLSDDEMADLRMASGPELDRKSTRLNSSHVSESRMPSSA